MYLIRLDLKHCFIFKRVGWSALVISSKIYGNGLVICFYPHALDSRITSSRAYFSIKISSVSPLTLSGIRVASVKLIPNGAGYQYL